MNSEEALRTPSKGTRPSSTSSPSSNTRGSAKKPTKNAKITNFFAKVNSPLTRTNSNSNHDIGDNQPQSDEVSKDASSNSMKMPSTCTVGEQQAIHKRVAQAKEYVFIMPSSDDDTNVSSKGSQGRRRKAPSVHSTTNSRSSDGLILTSNNNELGIGSRKRGTALQNQVDKLETTSNHEVLLTPTRSSNRDSRSRDSVPEKRAKVETVQNYDQNSGQKINRIQPTPLGRRTKVVDFQSVPSDLNLPRDQAMKLIEKLFLVKMPEDFFLFWEFAKTINHRKPCSAFSQTYLDWNLVGPYDVLSGLITDFHGFQKDHLLTHCRYFYDPPEFQTVISKRDTCTTHYGYWRDEPTQDKPIVVSNRAAQCGQLQEVGDNLFTLLKTELDASINSLLKSSQEVTFSSSSSSTQTTPSMASKNGRSKSIDSNSKQSQLERAKAKQELTIIRDKLLDFCSSYENIQCESWSRTNARLAKRFAKTFNGVGVVVPQNVDVAHRELGISDVKLRTMLSRISEFKEDKTKCGQYKDLHQIISNTVRADDKFDPGLGLELGLDLFYSGDTFYHKDIESLMTTAYKLLHRNEFIDILKAHLENRKKGDKVSLLD